MRTYYRCRDCLSAFTLDQPYPAGARCVCGGTPERMGVVCGNAYGDVDKACPCDARCTHAIGPNCDCQCGGKNHGSGVAAWVDQFVAEGRVVIRLLDEATAQRRATEFRVALAAAQARVEALRAGDPSRYSPQWYRADGLLRGAKRLKVHALRLKRLAQVAAEQQPKSPSLTLV